ncbi:lipocalin family protein [Streptomyces sp. NPDC005574]|uniref:lipocalin family protein n=1 Tax=Streptomyces sp. NPDC005574 TaxID=3156891 RepID=UPI0033ABCE89
MSFLRGADGHRHTDRANYLVVGLDEEYGWAVVTDSRRSSGFVPSRTPTLSGPQREGALRAIPLTPRADPLVGAGRPLMRVRVGRADPLPDTAPLHPRLRSHPSGAQPSARWEAKRGQGGR